MKSPNNEFRRLNKILPNDKIAWRAIKLHPCFTWHLCWMGVILLPLSSNNSLLQYFSIIGALCCVVVVITCIFVELARKWWTLLGKQHHAHMCCIHYTVGWKNFYVELKFWRICQWMLAESWKIYWTHTRGFHSLFTCFWASVYLSVC